MVKVRYRKFDEPTQIAFWDYEESHWTGGIGYGMEIICGCCGGVIDIDEIYEFAPEGIDPIHVFDEWLNLSGEIIGYNPGSEEMENLGKADEIKVIIS